MQPAEAFRVKRPSVTPPGGWSYTQPETGRTWERQDSIDLLAQEVRLHRAQNGLPEGDAEADIHQATGARLVDTGNSDRVETKATAVKRSVSDYFRGGKAFLAMRAAERNGEPLFVSQELAEQRAAICAECPANVDHLSSGIAKLADDQIAGMLGGRTTRLDDRLGVCAKCSCQARVPIHFVTGILKAGGLSPLTARKYPPNCWKPALLKP